MRKRKKCYKCGLLFKDREDPNQKGRIEEELCFNCGFIWESIGIMLKAVPGNLNRTVILHIDDIVIEKKRKKLGKKL